MPMQYRLMSGMGISRCRPSAGSIGCRKSTAIIHSRGMALTIRTVAVVNE